VTAAAWMVVVGIALLVAGVALGIVATIVVIALGSDRGGFSGDDEP
jgi:hypothetical protein